MVVLLADRGTVQLRRLHQRIKRRFQTDGRFSPVRFRIAAPRDPGPYRVIAPTDPRLFLAEETYPVASARIEVGFDRPGRDHDLRYWFNWIEPERDFLLGWHRDDHHPDLGPTHLQVSQEGEAVVHAPAAVIDAHPMAVVEARLAQLPATLSHVRWRGETATGIDA